MNASSVCYHKWSYTVENTQAVTVLPDGCRDILLIEQADSDRTVFLTNWDHRARTVELTQGQKMTGFRLLPGLFIDEQAMATVPASTECIVDFIQGSTTHQKESSDIICALSTSGMTVEQTARQSGVSVRTLQRHFHKLGLPRPDFWRLLARARSAAQACSVDTSLVEIADRYEFSDQSHMTREFVRWFGVTPHAMRHSPELLADVCQPGLGNWTSEQISIK